MSEEYLYEDTTDSFENLCRALAANDADKLAINLNTIPDLSEAFDGVVEFIANSSASLEEVLIECDHNNVYLGINIFDRVFHGSRRVLEAVGTHSMEKSRSFG